MANRLVCPALIRTSVACCDASGRDADERQFHYPPGKFLPRKDPVLYVKAGFFKFMRKFICHEFIQKYLRDDFELVAVISHTI